MQSRQIVAGLLRQGAVAVGLGLLAAAAGAAERQERPFVPHLVNSSTIPSNGDLNPYGVAFVPEGFPAGGALAPGDVLVSNFNNGGNLQGMGTTIIQLTPTGTLAAPGSATTFFASRLPGLTTALGESLPCPSSPAARPADREPPPWPLCDVPKMCCRCAAPTQHGCDPS
jgi:hypothetical protein